MNMMNSSLIISVQYLESQEEEEVLLGQVQLCHNDYSPELLLTGWHLSFLLQQYRHYGDGFIVWNLQTSNLNPFLSKLPLPQADLEVYHSVSVLHIELQHPAPGRVDERHEV